MPASSAKQKSFFQWASRHPEQAAVEGKAVGMSKPQMEDFAAEPVKKLAIHTPKVPVRSFGAKMPVIGKKRNYYGENK